MDQRTNTLHKKPRGRPFQKGNPGKPLGSRNKATVALEALLDGKAAAIVAKVAEKALEGDSVAMRLVFERVLGRRPERSLIDFDLPPIQSAADGAAAAAAILAAVGSGKISPSEGQAVMQMVDTTVRAFATLDVDRRIRALEEALKQPEP